MEKKQKKKQRIFTAVRIKLTWLNWVYIQDGDCRSPVIGWGYVAWIELLVKAIFEIFIGLNFWSAESKFPRGSFFWRNDRMNEKRA